MQTLPTIDDLYPKPTKVSSPAASIEICATYLQATAELCDRCSGKFEPLMNTRGPLGGSMLFAARTLTIAHHLVSANHSLQACLMIRPVTELSIRWLWAMQRKSGIPAAIKYWMTQTDRMMKSARDAMPELAAFLGEPIPTPDVVDKIMPMPSNLLEVITQIEEADSQIPTLAIGASSVKFYQTRIKALHEYAHANPGTVVRSEGHDITAAQISVLATANFARCMGYLLDWPQQEAFVRILHASYFATAFDPRTGDTLSE